MIKNKKNLGLMIVGILGMGLFTPIVVNSTDNNVTQNIESNSIKADDIYYVDPNGGENVNF